MTEYKVGEVADFTYAEYLAQTYDTWMICDGRALYSHAYPELFAALGFRWGGESTDDEFPRFNIPHLGPSVMGPRYQTYIKTRSHDVVAEVSTPPEPTGNGMYLLRREREEEKHTCSLPKLTIPIGSVWMCLTCHRVWKQKPMGWTPMLPWNAWRWRQKWKKQQIALR